MNPLETIVNGSSLATELTNISNYLLLVYQTALLEPLNNYRQEKGMISLLLALFSENIDPPNLHQKDDRLRKGITLQSQLPELRSVPKLVICTSE